jgi:hypothetical protein
MNNIIKKLQTAAKKQTEQNWNAYRTLRDNNAKVNCPGDANYRTAFGPFKVKEGVFRTDRFFFDPTTLEATSYGWWSMLTMVKGKLVRNVCGYSMQTAIHQGMLTKAMQALRIKADIVVHTKANIGDVPAWRRSELEAIAEAIAYSKRCRAKTRSYAKENIARLQRDFSKLVKAGIFKKISAKELKAAVASAEARKAKELQWKRERKQRENERQEERKQRVNEVPVYEERLEATTVNHLTLVKG